MSRDSKPVTLGGLRITEYDPELHGPEGAASRNNQEASPTPAEAEPSVPAPGEGSSPAPVAPGVGTPLRLTPGPAATPQVGAPLSDTGSNFSRVGPKVSDALGSVPEELALLGADYHLPTIEANMGWSGMASGIDLAKMRDDLYKAKLERAVFSGKPYDKNQLYAEARQDIERVSQRARGFQKSRIPGSDGVHGSLALVDTDPLGANAGLRRWVDGGQIPLDGIMPSILNATPEALRPALGPLFAGAMGSKVQTMDEGGEESVYNEGASVLGFVDWVGRAFDPGTYLATAARAAGADDTLDLFNPVNWYLGWGTEEQMRLLARGEDLFTLSDELNLQYANPTGWAIGEGLEAAAEGMGFQAEGLGESFAQGAMALGIALVTPDALGSAVGVGAKGVAAALPLVAKAAKIDAASKAATKSAELYSLRDEFQDIILNAETTEDVQKAVVDLARKLEYQTGDKSAAQALVTQLVRQVSKAAFLDSEVIAAGAKEADALAHLRKTEEDTGAVRAFTREDEQAQKAILEAEASLKSAEEAREAATKSVAEAEAAMDVDAADPATLDLSGVRVPRKDPKAVDQAKKSLETTKKAVAQAKKDLQEAKKALTEAAKGETPPPAPAPKKAEAPEQAPTKSREDLEATLESLARGQVTLAEEEAEVRKHLRSLEVDDLAGEAGEVVQGLRDAAAEDKLRYRAATALVQGRILSMAGKYDASPLEDLYGSTQAASLYLAKDLGVADPDTMTAAAAGLRRMAATRLAEAYYRIEETYKNPSKRYPSELPLDILVRLARGADLVTVAEDLRGAGMIYAADDMAWAAILEARATALAEAAEKGAREVPPLGDLEDFGPVASSIDGSHIFPYLKAAVRPDWYDYEGHLEFLRATRREGKGTPKENLQENIAFARKHLEDVLKRKARSAELVAEAEKALKDLTRKKAAKAPEQAPPPDPGATGPLPKVDAKKVKAAEKRVKEAEQALNLASADAKLKAEAVRKARKATVTGAPASVEEFMKLSIPKVNAAINEAGFSLAELRALKAAEEAGKGRTEMIKSLDTHIKRAEAPFRKARDAAADAAQAAAKTADEERVRLQEVTLAKAQIEHAKQGALHALLLENNIKTTLGTLRRLSAVADQKYAATKYTPEASAAAADRLKDATRQLTVAQQVYLDAGPETFDAAEKALEAAQKAYSKALSDATALDVAETIQRYEKIQAFAERLLRQKMATMEAVAETAKKELGLEYNVQDMVDALKTGRGDKPTIFRRADQTINSRASGVAALRAVETLAEQYARIADTAKGLDGFEALSLFRAARGRDDVALAASHIDVGRHAMHAKGIKRFFVGLQRAMEQVADPARQVSGMDNAEANQVLARTLGEVNIARRELAQVVNAEKTKGGRIEAVARWVDNVGESSVPTFVKDSFGGKSAWEAARPLLRTLAGSKEGQDEAPIKALAFMWLPPGQYSDAPFQGGLMKAARKLLQDDEATVDFMTFQARMREATEQVLGGYSPVGAAATSYRTVAEASRAMMMGGLGVAQAAALARGTGRLRQLYTGRFTDTAWLAASKLSKGMGEAMDGQEFQEGLEVLSELGQSMFFQQGRRDGPDLDLTWIGALDETSGEMAIVPRAWMQATSEHIGRIIKQPQLYAGGSYTAPTTMARVAASNIFRLVNASLITGLIFPRPSHFVNIFLGNFAQTWYERDPVKAAQFLSQTTLDLGVMGAQRLGDWLPGFGKHVDRALDHMVQKYGKGNALASPTSAMFNPVVGLLFDPKLGQPGKMLTGRSGVEVSVGDMRRWFVEEGVLTSFANSSGLAKAMRRNLDESAWEKFTGIVGAPSRLYADVADVIEQRQRAALFTDLILNEGMSPAEAGRAVRSALYDWNYPMTQFESRILSQMVMFWGFQRRAMGQAMTGIMEPFTDRASLGTLAKRTVLGSPGAALFGERAMKVTRVQDQARTMEAIRHTFGRQESTPTDTDGDGYISDDERQNWALRTVYPWWLAHESGSRASVANVPMDEFEANFFRRYTGINMTHKAYTMPSFTPLEMTNMLMGLGSLLAAWPTSGSKLGDLRTLGYEYLAPMGGPVSEQAIKGAVDAFVGPDGKAIPTHNGVRVKKQADRYFLMFADKFAEFLGMDSGEHAGLVWPDPDQPGVIRADPGLWATYKMALPLSFEATNMAEPFLTARSQPTYARSGLWVLTQLLGLPKAYPHAPADTLGYNQREIKSVVGRKERAYSTEKASIGDIIFGADPEEVRAADTAKQQRMLGRGAKSSLGITLKLTGD